MTRTYPRVRCALAVTAFFCFASSAFGEDRIACTFDPGENSSCGLYTCVPDVPADMDENLIVVGTAGFCGKCTSDRQCGGAKCNKVTGFCSAFTPSPRPEPIWPHFNLLVTDVTHRLNDVDHFEPIVSAGYLFQGAFGKTHPQKFDEHSFLTTDLPKVYWDVGATVAFVGRAQNAYVHLGLTRYMPGGPFWITTLSLGVEHQRQGVAIWRPGSEVENADRVGPSLSVGFLQNIFIRLTLLAHLRGQDDQTQLILGVSYMKNLLGDLIPDRFIKFLPAELK